MPLSAEQVSRLLSGIEGYRFPFEYFDHRTGRIISADSMVEVENAIGALLKSEETTEIIEGLANVIFWGYAQMGIRRYRHSRFLQHMRAEKALAFRALVAGAMPSLSDIRRLRLPEFSGISFTSKILMFLNPQDYCVLDMQLARLAAPGSLRALDRLRFAHGDTQIRITAHNEEVYEAWRRECRSISENYFGGQYRAADIERGLFSLLQRSEIASARSIYRLS